MEKKTYGRNKSNLFFPHFQARPEIGTSREEVRKAAPLIFPERASSLKALSLQKMPINSIALAG